MTDLHGFVSPCSKGLTFSPCFHFLLAPPFFLFSCLVWIARYPISSLSLARTLSWPSPSLTSITATFALIRYHFLPPNITCPHCHLLSPSFSYIHYHLPLFTITSFTSPFLLQHTCQTYYGVNICCALTFFLQERLDRLDSIPGFFGQRGWVVLRVTREISGWARVTRPVPPSRFSFTSLLRPGYKSEHEHIV